MKVALVDDRLLGAILRGDTPHLLRRRTIATTGYWYLRLCQAVLVATDRTGRLSGPFAVLPAPQRRAALAALLELPEDITLASMRELAPVMGMLRSQHRLNVLSVEVVAAAERHDADVFLSSASPRLEIALAAEGRRVRRIEP